jgi:WD40 repeat protein
VAELATEGLSPTVRAAAGTLGDELCSAGQLITAILERHRHDYAHGASDELPVDWPTASRRAPAAAWLAEIRELVSREVHPDLHGRVVILGASIADPVTGRAVVTAGLFQALAEELSPTFYLSLTDPGKARLGLIPITVPISGLWTSTVPRPERVEAVALSPSGALVAAGHGDGHVTVLDRKRTATHRERSSDDGGRITALTFSGDGTRLAFADDLGNVTVSGPVGHPVLHRIKADVRTPIDRLRFDPAGNRLVGTTPASGIVTVHPAAGTQAVAQPPGASPVVALSRDGLRVAWVGDDGNLKAGAPDLTDPVLDWQPAQPGVHALALSPDGALLAAGHDSAVAVYSASWRRSVETPSPVTGLAFSRDGTRLAVATGQGERYVVSTVPDEPPVELPAMPRVSGICFSPDGRWIAMVSSYGLRLDDARTGAPVLHIEGASFTSLDVSWDRLVLGTDGGGIVSLDIGLEPSGARGIAGFSADDVEIADDLEVSLGIDEDVLAFASLIASTEVDPPLSVGLFGDWGSGKTFFMRRLRRRIEQLSLATRATGAMQKDAPFHKRIAQIEFNAWHFAEGNLWASLVQHVLEQLELPEEKTSAMEARKRDLVNKIAEQDAAVDVSDADVEKLEQSVKTLEAEEKEMRAAAADHATDAKVLAGEDPLAAAGDAAETARDALEAVGWKTGGQTLDELSATVSEASDVIRRGALLYGNDDPKFRRLVIGIVAAPLVALLIGVALVLLDASALLASVAAIATTATAVLGVAAKLVGTQLKYAKDRLDGLEKARAELEAARQRHADKLAAARRDAADAREHAREARRKRQEVEQELAQLKPERLLDELLSKRLKSGAYKRHLGLLELVRSDFETITDYLAEKAEDAEKAENAESEDTGVSRIVLYIDDLDRCEPARVVEVLKAVHLLLAMKLFVVVVGVDVRWVSGALETRHDLLGGERMASSRDYLEKIFQIPFWIEPLDVHATRSMLRALVGVAGAPPADRAVVRQAAPAPPESGNGAGPPLAGSGATAGAAPRAPAPREGGREPAAGPPPPPPPQPEARPEQLEIGELEHGFTDRLAPLLGRSPRALKRFVNTYRLFKAREPNYEAFLSEVPETPGSDVAAYRAVLFVLAVATGLPTLGDVLLDDMVDTCEGTVRETLERIAPPDSDEAARLRAWLDSEAGADWGAVPVSRLRERTAQVVRFTFHWQPSGVQAAGGPAPPRE